MKHSDLHGTVKMASIVKLVVHALGLCGLLCGVLLSVFVFSNILDHGYFLGLEPDMGVLVVEFGLTVYGLAYFIFLAWNMRSRLKLTFKGETK